MVMILQTVVHGVRKFLEVRRVVKYNRIWIQDDAYGVHQDFKKLMNNIENEKSINIFFCLLQQIM